MVLLLHPRISIAISPDYNHLRKSLHDVLFCMRFGLARDHLPLKRSSLPYYSGSREQQLKSSITMATKSENLVVATKSENLVESSTDEKDKVEEDKKGEVSLPPPPEKPEPGDCCGSGCVRCVWDVYYDELEEYNKLSSSISGETTKSN